MKTKNWEEVTRDSDGEFKCPFCGKVAGIPDGFLETCEMAKDIGFIEEGHLHGSGQVGTPICCTNYFWVTYTLVGGLRYMARRF